MEDTLREVFLSALFKGATSYVSVRVVTGFPVKQAGIGLPNPTQTVGSNWTSSCVITGNLVAALHRTADFRLGVHALLM